MTEQQPFIIGGTTYLIGGSNLDSIGIRIETPDIPESIEFQRYHMLRKPELHVTLVPVGKISAKHSMTNVNMFSEVLTMFKEFVVNKQIRVVSYTGEFRFVEQDDRKTIVTMCNVENLKEFFELLNQKYSATIELPPTHITLYTLNGGLGIFLIDQSDIANLTKLVTIPELQGVQWPPSKPKKPRSLL